MVVVTVHLLGAIALLLWAVGLIRSGVERGFMPQLRLVVRRCRKVPMLASLSGAIAAMAMQSATGVAVLAAGLVRTGALAAPVALGMLLGADLGSAIVAWVLLTPVTWLVPVLLVAGITLYQRTERVVLRQSGRMITGLALVFVALDMLRAATLPLRESDITALAVAHLSDDYLSAFVIGAGLTWLLHSSVAAILTFATLLAEGVLALPVTLVLVMGANLGGALIPLTLTHSDQPDVRKMVLGNLFLRGGGALLALLALPLWLPVFAAVDLAPHYQAILAHVCFNFLAASLGLFLVPPVLALLDRLLSPFATAPDAQISALDDGALSDPDQALACAAREVLRMGEHVHAMLAPALQLFQNWDEATARTIATREDEVDKMHFDIKLYVARLQEGQLSAEQSRRAMDIASIAANLEDAGDQISSNLLDLARRMHDEGLSFSKKGWRDLSDFHDRVLANTQLALNVLMTSDPEAARQLIAEKDRARMAEKSLQARHLARLRAGKPSSIATSNLHQETVRALKQINSAMSFIAYPIAEQAGDLLSSRLSGQHG